MALCSYFHIFMLNTKDGSTVRYGTPQFCEEIRYAGTVRFFCDGTGTVRWYGTPFLLWYGYGTLVRGLI